MSFFPQMYEREDGLCFASHPMNENPKIGARKLQIIAGRLPRLHNLDK
jgi:hypothetical protein